MGRYDGTPVVVLLDDGRRVQLREDFAFVDDKELRWDVPAKAIVDGASIPQALWTIIGGPFEGRYRNSSIIHDWYCDLRSRPWKHVHRMFYEAMLASGVGKARAKLMYAGVYMGGPRWSETVVSNVSLMAEEYLKSSNETDRRLHYPMPIDEFGNPVRWGPYADTGQTKITKTYHYEFTKIDLDDIRNKIKEDSTLENIETVIDKRTVRLEEIITHEKREVYNISEAPN